MLAAGNHQRRDLGGKHRQPRLEVAGAGHRRQLGLVGEQDVDLAGVDQRPETIAVAVDAEGVAEREGDLAAGGARGGDRGFHRRARLGRVPQIALEIEDCGVGDGGRVDVARMEPLGGAEEGVHRPLGIGGDQDQRRARWRRHHPAPGTRKSTPRLSTSWR